MSTLTRITLSIVYSTCIPFHFLTIFFFFFFQAEDGIRDVAVTGVQTCALPVSTACRAQGPNRRDAVGRRAADARDRPRPHVPGEAPRHRRAFAGSRAAHPRGAVRGDPAHPRRGNRGPAGGAGGGAGVSDEIG